MGHVIIFPILNFFFFFVCDCETVISKYVHVFRHKALSRDKPTSCQVAPKLNIEPLKLE